MRISLVFPPYYHQNLYNLPPLGLISLGSVLARENHAVTIHDFVLDIRRGILKSDENIYDRCASAILDQEPDLVAFSVQCTTFPPAAGIAERLRRLNPKTHIVFGGHSVSAVDERTLDLFPFVDSVVRGEGEATFAHLVSVIGSRGWEEGVAGVTWRQKGNIVKNPDRELIEDLDTLPRLDYSLASPLETYREACGLQRSVAVLEAGRGCPHTCIYCSQSDFWRRKMRRHSVRRLVEEMKRLVDEQDAQSFLLVYDQFTAEPTFVREFCRGVIDGRLNRFPWFCISRLDTIDPPLLALMREAGCSSMCYGIDSGSEKTLSFIRKRIDHKILFRKVRETTDAGMRPTLSFVIGFPEEERKDIDATLELALLAGARGDSSPLIQLPTVLQGTELARRYKEELQRGVDTYFSEGIAFDSGARLSEDEARIERAPDLFCSFYNIPSRDLSIEELSLLTTYFPLIVELYPKTFLLLSKRMGNSPSVLFRRLSEWIRRREEMTLPLLDQQNICRHFNAFVLECLWQMEREVPHLPEVLAYEDAAIATARLAGEAPTPRIAAEGNEKFPERDRTVLIREFSFPLAEIVEDIRNGHIDREYHPQPSYLVFRQTGNTLDVVEINRFGTALLHGCDGSRSIESVAASIYSDFGEDMTLGGFAQCCRDAAKELCELRFLQT